MPHKNSNSTFQSRFKVFHNRIEKVLYETPDKVSLDKSTFERSDLPETKNDYSISLISVPPPSSSNGITQDSMLCQTLWQGSIRLTSIETLFISEPNQMPVRGILEMINKSHKAPLNCTESIFAKIELDIMINSNRSTIAKTADGKVFTVLIKDRKKRDVMLGIKFQKIEEGQEFGQALERLIKELEILKRYLESKEINGTSLDDFKLTNDVKCCLRI